MMRSTTHKAIYALLRDGTPRTCNEIAKAIGVPWKPVSDAVLRMGRKGWLIPAAGCAYTPKDGHIAKRWVVNAEVTA